MNASGAQPPNPRTQDANAWSSSASSARPRQSARPPIRIAAIATSWRPDVLGTRPPALLARPGASRAPEVRAARRREAGRDEELAPPLARPQRHAVPVARLVRLAGAAVEVHVAGHAA